MELLTNKDITGLVIGDWKSSETPDGTIIWTKPKRLFRKSSPIAVFATPHHDKSNVVSVDVTDLSSPYDDVTLSTKLFLKGKDVYEDLSIYIKGMTTIFSMIV
jgi:hypothetical protein